MIQIAAIALISAVLIVYLKSVNSELALLATVGACIIVLFYAFSYLGQVVEFFDKIADLTGIDNEFYKIIFKITAIGYLVEFAAGVVEDFGLKSLADKLIFSGKIIILSVSMPIIYAVFNLLTGILQ